MARYWICPNCRTRAIDDDGRDGLSHQQVGCAQCGFGFLFELLEDFYPPANAGMVACDRDTRVLSAGKGVFELTGYGEKELLGKPLVEALGLTGWNGDNPVSVVMEWGVLSGGDESAERRLVDRRLRQLEVVERLQAVVEGELEALA